MIDNEILNVLNEEKERQNNTLEMIASESLQPKFSLELQGSIFNNKTAVGNIGNQRLKGSHVIEKLEVLASNRAKEVFNADYANMFPYSGSMANFCAYSAVCSVGDNILALDPSVGAHQSHGGSKNVSSKIYNFKYFGLNKKTLDIDYDKALEIAKEFKPKLIVVGSAAYPRQINYEKLSQIAKSVDACLMADIAHFSGLIAGGVSNNPFPYADIVTASCTKTMCGPHTGFIMCKKEYEERVKNSVYPGNVASLHLQTIAATAYCLERSKTTNFKNFTKQIVKNAVALTNCFIKEGFGVFTGGTDCHIILLDLNPFNVTGEDFANALEGIGISVNSKAIPFDTAPVAMGVRLGTTVLTQRGMVESDMALIAKIFKMVIDGNLKGAKTEVDKLVKKFPIPNEII